MLSIIIPLADSHLYVHMRSLVRRRKYRTRGRCRTTERWKYLSCLSKQCTQNVFRQIELARCTSRASRTSLLGAPQTTTRPAPGHNCRGRRYRPRMGVRTGAARVADCGCAAARWGHWRKPRIWGDVDNARTVDGSGVPAWDGAEYHAGQLGWVCRARDPTAAVSPAVFLYRIFIGEEGDTNADCER